MSFTQMDTKKFQKIVQKAFGDDIYMKYNTKRDANLVI